MGDTAIRMNLRNQQLSVSALLAVILAIAAGILGFFVSTNTYSLLAGGFALLLATRATLYAFTGSVYARFLPVVALAFSTAAMFFCIVWPYVADGIMDRLEGVAQPPVEAAPTVSAPADTNSNAQKDLEQYKLIKKQMEEQQKNAVKPPTPAE